MTSPYNRKPEFVMMGFVADNGPHQRVGILASTQLTIAELQTEYDRRNEEFLLGQGNAVNVKVRYKITAEMKNYIVALGEDYPSAFATLFGQWEPPRDEPRQLEQQRQLGAE